MAINYPTSLDSLTNPLSTDLLTSPAHSTQHSNVNDAVEALEAKVGADASAVTTSHDYKLGEVTGTDKAVGKTATQTLTNKTLTAPQINMGSDATGDTYYRTAGGAFARLPIGTSGQILQSNASSIPEWIANPSAADASTTVKGVVEEATLAETLARTTAGGTSARLFVNPSTLTTVQTYDYAASSGGTDTYAITVTPAPTAYVTGQVFTFKADVINTGVATLNVNSLGAKSILRPDSSALADGDIAASQFVQVIYDGTNMLMISPIANSPKIAHGVISRVMSTAGGAVTTAHGLGRAPRLVRFEAVLPQEGTVSATPHSASFGSYNGSTTATIYVGYNNASNDSGTDTTNAVRLVGVETSTDQRAVCTVDATNITLTWTKTGSPTTGTGLIRWEAIA